MTLPAFAGYSACIEMLFAPEADDFLRRVQLAADAGFETIEFWGSDNKNIDAVAEAVAKAKVSVSGFSVEPSVALSDPANHVQFLDQLATARDTALRLGAERLVVVVGNKHEAAPREQQRAAIASCLRRAADVLKGTGIVLAVEPINTGERKDGYLHSTKEGLDIVDAVDRSEVKLLYDMYHSAWMGETLLEVLAGRVDRIAHVHLADHPGRHEPGTGGVRWREGLAWLRANGFAGKVGLEYRPAKGTVEGLRFLD